MVTKIWQSVKRMMGYRGVTEYSPIWYNKHLQELLIIGKIKEWERHGIKRLIQLYGSKTLKSFAELRHEYGI